MKHVEVTQAARTSEPPEPTRVFGAYLLAYFLDERGEDGEQIRLAVSRPHSASGWTPLAGGRPLLTSSVGENGVRDPFLIRDDHSGMFTIIATDLRTWPGTSDQWERAVRRGSRAIAVWQSPDLTTWTGPWLAEVSPSDAGNTWAPKAVWSDDRSCWRVFWASAVYARGSDRTAREHQRIMVADTRDFHEFSPAEVYLDRGHDIIDLLFAEEGGQWFRFSADAQPLSGGQGGFIAAETGPGLDDVGWRPLRDGIGSPELERAEGPAIAASPGGGWDLLIDEYGLRGYQLYHADDLASGVWTRSEEAGLPAGARHGSLLPITLDERERLLQTDVRVRDAS